MATLAFCPTDRQRKSFFFFFYCTGWVVDKDDHEMTGLPLKIGLERDMSGKSLDFLIIQYYVMKVTREPSTDRPIIVTSSRNGGLCDFWKTEGNQWSLSSGGFFGETQRCWQSRFPCSNFFYVLIFLTVVCAGQYQHQGQRQMQS